MTGDSLELLLMSAARPASSSRRGSCAGLTVSPSFGHGDDPALVAVGAARPRSTPSSIEGPSPVGDSSPRPAGAARSSEPGGGVAVSGFVSGRSFRLGRCQPCSRRCANPPALRAGGRRRSSSPLQPCTTRAPRITSARTPVYRDDVDRSFARSADSARWKVMSARLSRGCTPTSIREVTAGALTGIWLSDTLRYGRKLEAMPESGSGLSPHCSMRSPSAGSLTGCSRG